MRAHFFVPALLLFPLAAPAAVTISIPAVPPPPVALPFAVGGRSPDGHVLSANSRCLTLDGRPWFPVMGEFHYSRYPADEWQPELLKMKAGGITVVSTYVVWIHHEEVEGRFDWAGRRDLRSFVELCARDGLKVWVRIGPWDHGEVRNGGFPDWLVNKVADLRSNDPTYLRYVARFYGQIGRQLQGLFWKDGGPIVGVQIENEYHPPSGGVAHMRRLLALAHAAGISAPFYSATGWDNAAVPPTGFLPVFGGYTDQFWSRSLRELPPNENFFFTSIRAEDNVMGDLQPKNPGYNLKYEDFPFLTAEMGGGMATAYHRRPVMRADDSTAAALVKLGSGVSLLGYYMYHGGTNPEGLTSLEETQLSWEGFNDLEAKGYDFQAPLGEFGQVRETYRTMKILHLFLAGFGSELAPMPAYLPKERPRNRDDRRTPRVAVRSDGRQAFIFINNYERNYALDDHPDFQISLHLPSRTLTIPRQPTNIPSGVYTLWPVNLDVAGVPLRYATAQLLCRLENPRTYVFFAWEGTRPEFAFAAGRGDRIEAPGDRIVRAGDCTYVDGINPGDGAAIRVIRAGGGGAQILLLSHEQALHFWKARLAGRERLILSPADLYFDGDRVHLADRDPRGLSVELYPGLARVPAGFRDRGPDGVFRRYDLAAEEPAPPMPVAVTLVKRAAPAAPIRVGSEPRAVAMEPADSAFERAAVWNLALPPAALHGPGRTFLEISYVGDVARLYVDGRFFDDNFYKGPPWELGAWRLSPAGTNRDAPLTVQLRILPLPHDAPIYLESQARSQLSPTGDSLDLQHVSLTHEYDAVLDARP